jgi:hypothetical protein
MGAELLGWLAKGPLKLHVSRQHKRQIVHQLTQVADWWRSLGEDAESDFASRVGECPVPMAQSLVEDEESFLRLIAWLTEPDENGQARTPRQLISMRLNKLLDWPPNYGTVAWTQDPDDPSQVLVFAGELSHGDLPETAGYRHLQLLALTGVGALVGIKLLAPCITLTLTD